MSAKMHGTELSGVKAVPCDAAVLKQKETGRLKYYLCIKNDIRLHSRFNGQTNVRNPTT